MAEAKKGSVGSNNGYLSEVKKKLLERKAELEQELANLAYPKEVPSEIQDIGDHAQSLSIENLNISLQDNELEEYHMVRQALRMIDEGVYGICMDCEQPISEKRLKLYPNATRCLVCQEILEEQKHESL